MQSGKSIQDLANALAHARAAAKDYGVPASSLRAIPVTTDANGAPVAVGRVDLAFTAAETTVTLEPTPWASGQLANYADVPKAYFDRIVRENPRLAADSVNHGLDRMNGDQRMIRALDSKARAILSPSYRRLDSANLVDATLPALIEAGMELVSSDLTERRLYLRATTPKLQGEIARGDVVQAGIMISNSDVGAGSLRVETFLVRLLCTNGMVRDSAIKKAHLGGRLFGGDDVAQELLTAETVRLGEAAFFAEVRDVVAGLLRPERFEQELQKMRDAAERKITNFDLQAVVDMTIKKVGLQTTQAVTKSIVELLAAGNQGAGLTAYGLANSFTAAASNPEVDFDHGVELERAGGKILDLNAGDWRVIAEKKAA